MGHYNITPDSTMPSEKITVFISCLIIAILVLASYANSLGNPFIWDDEILIENNTLIKDWSNTPAIFTQNLGAGAGGTYSYYRPMHMIVNMLDYSFWKREVKGYHFTSIALHILACLCVYWLICALFHDRLIALCTGVLFAVHPVHTEVVTYISGRGDSLVAVFMIISLLFYVKYTEKRGIASYLIMVSCYIAALLSKENSLILPALLVLYHYTFRKPVRKEACGVIILLAGIYLFLRIAVLRFSDFDIRDFSGIEQRIPGSFVSLAQYIRLLIFPADLHMDYGQKIFTFGDLRTVAGIFICAVLIMTALAAKKRNTPLFFGISWFLLSLLPSINIYPVAFYMSEHYLYIPSIGFFLIAGYFCRILYEKRRPMFAIAVMIIITLSFLFLTVRQNTVWNDPVRFYERILTFTPESAVANNNLAIVYGKRGDLEKAIRFFKISVKLKPDNVHAYVNLGKAYSALGRREEAIAYYRKAIEIAPDKILAYYNLGDLYHSMGRYRAAVDLYIRALKINPNFLLAHYDLGNAYKKLGLTKKAIASYGEAIRIDGSFANAYHQMGLAYLDMGDYDKAIVYLKKSSEIDPQNAYAHHSLAFVYSRLGRDDIARAHAEQARSLGAKSEFLDELLKSHEKIK